MTPALLSHRAHSRSHHLEAIGGVLYVFSIFMLSLARPGEYYQVCVSLAPIESVSYALRPRGFSLARYCAVARACPWLARSRCHTVSDGLARSRETRTRSPHLKFRSSESGGPLE